MPDINITIVPSRELATGEASRMALSKLKGALACRTPPPPEKKQTTRDIIPIFGIRWNPHVVRRAGENACLTSFGHYVIPSWAREAVI